MDQLIWDRRDKQVVKNLPTSKTGAPRSGFCIYFVVLITILLDFCLGPTFSKKLLGWLDGFRFGRSRDENDAKLRQHSDTSRHWFKSQKLRIGFLPQLDSRVRFLILGAQRTLKLGPPEQARSKSDNNEPRCSCPVYPDRSRSSQLKQLLLVSRHNQGCKMSCEIIFEMDAFIPPIRNSRVLPMLTSLRKMS